MLLRKYCIYGIIWKYKMIYITITNRMWYSFFRLFFLFHFSPFFEKYCYSFPLKLHLKLSIISIIFLILNSSSSLFNKNKTNEKTPSMKLLSSTFSKIFEKLKTQKRHEELKKNYYYFCQ